MHLSGRVNKEDIKLIKLLQEKISLYLVMSSGVYAAANTLKRGSLNLPATNTVERFRFFT